MIVIPLIPPNNFKFGTLLAREKLLLGECLSGSQFSTTKVPCTARLAR